MHRLFSLCASILLLTMIAFAEGEQKFANLGECNVESGEVIHNCRIGYRTWGTLNEQRSNAVVLLTWFTGNSEMLAENVGPDKYVDPGKYYVIVIDALADGVSSSPSNSKSQPRSSAL
jgi:homoserine O-acetyltransferase